MERKILSIMMLVLAACGGDVSGVQPEDCSADEVYQTECSDCGPVDECIDPQAVCAPVCEGDFTPCDDDGGVCMSGACLHNVCG